MDIKSVFAEAFDEDIAGMQPVESYDQTSSLTQKIKSNSFSLDRDDAFVAYDACSRLCWAYKMRAGFECMEEVSYFLENDGDILKKTFNVPHFTQRFEEPDGTMIVQVVQVRMKLKTPKLKRTFCTIKSKLSSRWQTLKTLTGVSSLHTTPSANKETYLCLVRLKSSPEDHADQMQPIYCMQHISFIFQCNSLTDDEDALIVEVQDAERNLYGRAKVDLLEIIGYQDEKLLWWSVYRESEEEIVGKIQLDISYTSNFDDKKKVHVDSVSIYDNVLKAVLKAERLQQRSLSLPSKWKWLLCEFASHYGVSHAYTKLRYLTYVMDVATPTADCISLVYDLLLPVKEGHSKNTLSRLENRILGEVEEQIEHILALIFENYKSLDEQSPSGMRDIFMPATKVVAPVLEHAVKLYVLIHDASSPEGQKKLYDYFQAAVAKRSRCHLAETDNYVSGYVFMDPVAVPTACDKMKSLCLNIKNEILSDIEIHNYNILPSFINLPKLSSAIYSADLLRRFGAFVAACPPSVPFSHVTDVVIETADVVKDLSRWNIE